MESYSFFDAVNQGGTYDRTYASADFADYFSSFISNGVFLNPSSSLQVQPSSGLTLAVQPGKAWINGYFYSLSESAKSLTLTRGDNRYARIDKVVCRLNLESRLIEVKVIEGTPSPSPSVPAHERTDSHYDLVLAQVSVAAGATAIAAKDITDKRQDESVCGVVAGVVKQVETSALFAQFKDSFDTWFDTVKGRLDGDTAGKLANEIDSLSTEVTSVKSDYSALQGDVTTLKTNVTTVTNANSALEKKVATNTLNISTLQGKITISSTAAPATGTANTVYLQML